MDAKTKAGHIIALTNMEGKYRTIVDAMEIAEDLYNRDFREKIILIFEKEDVESLYSTVFNLVGFIRVLDFESLCLCLERLELLLAGLRVRYVKKSRKSLETALRMITLNKEMKEIIININYCLKAAIPYKE